MEHLAGGEGGADDSSGAGNAEFTAAQCDLGPELIGNGVVNPDAGSLAVEKAAGCFGDLAEQRVEIGGDGEHARHAEKELHLRSRDRGGMAVGAGGWVWVGHRLRI